MRLGIMQRTGIVFTVAVALLIVGYYWTASTIFESYDERLYALCQQPDSPTLPIPSQTDCLLGQRDAFESFFNMLWLNSYYLLILIPITWDLVYVGWIACKWICGGRVDSRPLEDRPSKP